jgi:hypothetical protein
VEGGRVTRRPHRVLLETINNGRLHLLSVPRPTMRDLLWHGWRKQDVIEARVDEHGTVTIENLSLRARRAVTGKTR